MAVSKNELAYLAGFIDGEGCLNIRKNPNWVIRVQVYNTKPSVIYWIRDSFGGRVWMKEHPADKNWKSSYTYEATAKIAYLLLKAVFPFLRLKKEQAEMLIRFQEEKDKRKKMNGQNKIGQFTGIHALSEEELSRRGAMLNRIAELNKRGK